MAEQHAPEITFIRNRPASRKGAGDEPSQSARKRKPSKASKGESASAGGHNTREPRVTPDERLRHVLAIALIVSGFLVLLSIVSYTPLDQANADLRISDVSGLMTNDPAVIARADTTNNWLGLVGALVANFLINGTIGYWVIIIPLLLGLWGVTTYRAKEVERSTRLTLFTIGITANVAAILGTMQLITWLPAPSHEWSGAIGAFIAYVLSGLIGTAGSMLVLLSALGITLLYAVDLDLKDIVAFVRKHGSELARGAASVRARFDRPGDEGGRVAPDVAVEPAEAGLSVDEPARMIRRRKGVDTPFTAVEPQIRTVDDRELRTSRSPLPDLQQAAPPAVQRPRETTSEVRTGDTSAPNVPNEAVRLRAPEAVEQDTSNVEVVRGEDPTPTPPPAARLTLNVQEGETEADVESTKGDALLSRIKDEEIKYVPPPVLLLTPQNEHEEVRDEELKENGRILQEKLGTFNIQIENLTVTPGPVVTLYEFVPAAGIKISQIESLTDDIALAMKARGIRIIAPIPGKGTVGVEIPNHRPTMVRIRSVLNTTKFREADLRLPLALGKTTIGEVYCDDLTKMPHLLIAGATGSGKSVGINAILASLIYKMHPRDLKLVIVDPKKIELTQYRTLASHFLAQCPDIDEDIITTPQNAVMALKSLEMEMDRRYDILAKGRQRNIADYNQKIAEGAYASVADFDHRKLPYIVLILDELADLMITARGEVEEPIARLAQLARAVGIHMVVATQRPSVDVLTGTIKANFPARIAYQVASKIDSRTILDMSGAEYLLGNGDMLYLPGGSPKPIRLQNAFISTEEVEAICDHVGDQQGFTTPYMLPSMLDRRRAGSSGGDDSRDELFEDAAKLVVRHQQGSVSLVQRRLKVGYSRAARIIDELEMAGIVGPFDGSKARQVLVEDEDDLDLYL